MLRIKPREPRGEYDFSEVEWARLDSMLQERREVKKEGKNGRGEDEEELEAESMLGCLEKVENGSD